jgi:rSAM/selenodomain-associated transferase 2
MQVPPHDSLAPAPASRDGGLGFLSVVIPALDEAEALPATLAALTPWRAAGAEVLLVDGGSADATVAIAEALVDKVLLSPRGRAVQMNTGWRAARGELLLFLHADTVLSPAAALALADAWSSGVLWGRFDVRLAGSHPLLPLVAALINLRSRLSGIATGDQGLFVQRRVLDELGGYPDMPLMEDLWLSRQLRSRCWPCCLGVPITTSARRWERHGVLRTILLMWCLRTAWMLGYPAERLARAYAAR